MFIPSEKKTKNKSKKSQNKFKKLTKNCQTNQNLPPSLLIFRNFKIKFKKRNIIGFRPCTKDLEKEFYQMFVDELEKFMTSK
jgi:hypothetical protein